MSLKYILLGMLREPQCGYDIRKEFDESLRNFWRAELSQIYPLLGKMEQDGLLRTWEGESDIGPRKRFYKRTAKGRKALIRWLAEGPAVGAERIGYLAQVYFLGDLDNPDAAIAFIEKLRDHMAKWLNTLDEAEQQWRSNAPGYPDELPDEDFYPQLTLAFGLKKVRSNLEWCEESLERIRKRSSADH